MEEKRKLQWRRGRDGIVQYPHLFFAALALALVVADPFRLSPLAGVDYRPVKHELAPYGEVMGRWPRDNASRLRRGRLEFVGEVFGPESIEFDGEGRGPYAGLADGRVVFDGGAFDLTEDVARQLYGLEAGEVMDRAPHAVEPAALVA